MSLPREDREMKFLPELYALNNADVVVAIGGENPDQLYTHYQSNGRYEIRFPNSNQYINLEDVFYSSGGHFLLVGWADRRILGEFKLTVEVGYVCFDIINQDFCWHSRPDVNTVIGGSNLNAGFICLVQLSNLTLSSRVTIRLGALILHFNEAARWLSPDNFLNRALGAACAIADKPIGIGLESANFLFPAFHSIWNEYRSSLNYVKVFDNSVSVSIRRSIVIVQHRQADFLLEQLGELSRIGLPDDAEILLVGNELENAVTLCDNLTAYCLVNKVNIRMFLCSGNSGFSAANNFAATVALGETLFFMNPDIFPSPTQSADEFKEFWSAPLENELTGHLLYYGTGSIMHSGMFATYDLAFDPTTASHNKALRIEHLGKDLRWHIEDVTCPIKASSDLTVGKSILASAALWKINKDLFVRSGGFSTDYIFAYYEDADYCMRFLTMGGRIVVDPSSRWIHLEGAGKPMSSTKRCFMWLNRALFTQRFGDSTLLVEPIDSMTLI